MRYLIYILVVANCLFFAWNMLVEVPEAEIAVNLPPLPSDVRTLTTLQERETSTDSADVADIERLTAMHSPGAGIPLTCHVLGPFTATADMQTASEQLRELGFEPQPRSSEVQKQIGYWVYLPTLGHDQAVQVVEVLKENNVRDYFIGAENFVSLGIYRELESANKHRDRIRALGFEPRIEPRFASQSVHWLDLENFEAAAGQPILEAFPETRLQELACR